MDSDEVRRQWADRSGEYSPEYYAYYGPDERSEAVREVLERFLDRDAHVLELGCSSGRHLAHLLDGGFEHLSGVEVNDHAFEVMEEAFPDLAARGTFHAGAIEDVVDGFEDGRFDAVFSVETLQHVHPDAAWVFEELTRVADGLLVTVENEGNGGGERVDGRGGSAGGDDVNYVDESLPLYYRDWRRVFTALGWEEVASEAGDRDTLRAFRPPRDPDR